MKKLLVTALLIAASLLIVGTTLTAGGTVKTSTCKTVKYNETKLVWNAKHTKKVRVVVTKLVKETIKVNGKLKTSYVEEPVVLSVRICTAAKKATAPTTTTTEPVAAITPAPTTTIAPTPTTPITPSPTTTTTTTTVSPTTTTTTPPQGPAPSSIVTETTMNPEDSNYTLPAGDCSQAEGCATPNVTVFSAITKETANGDLVTPGAGRLSFVFDDPAPDVDVSPDAWEFDQFTLTTTQNGQTSCAVIWVDSHVLIAGYWQVQPISVSIDGIPACDFTNVWMGVDVMGGVGHSPSVQNSECTPTTGLQTLSLGSLTCPNTPSTGTETDGDIIGAGLIWSITAEYGGEGADGASYAAPQALTLTN